MAWSCEISHPLRLETQFFVDSRAALRFHSSRSQYGIELRKYVIRFRALVMTGAAASVRKRLSLCLDFPFIVSEVEEPPSSLKPAAIFHGSLKRNELLFISTV